MAYDPYESATDLYIKRFLLYFYNLEDGQKYPSSYDSDPELKTVVEQLAIHLKTAASKKFKLPSPELKIEYMSSNSKRWDDGAFVSMTVQVIQDFGGILLILKFPFDINRKGYCSGCKVNFEWFYSNEERRLLGVDGEQEAENWSIDSLTALPKLLAKFRASIKTEYLNKVKQIREINSYMTQNSEISHGLGMDNAKKFGWQLITLKRFMKSYKIAFPDT